LLEPSIPIGPKINFDHETTLNIDSLFEKKEEVSSSDIPYDVNATF